MATLPIATSYMTAPVGLDQESVLDINESASRNLTVVGRGGHRFRYELDLRPLNVNSVSLAAEANEITAFLDENAIFEVPILNFEPVTTTGTIQVDAAAPIGVTTVDVAYALTTTPSLPEGSYIVFSNKSKVYRIKSESRSGGSTDATWTLTHPLRQSLTTSHTVTYTGTDGKSNAFNGVLGSFVNENFGGKQYIFRDGVLLDFRPLNLLENI